MSSNKLTRLTPRAGMQARHGASDTAGAQRSQRALALAADSPPRMRCGGCSLVRVLSRKALQAYKGGLLYGKFAKRGSGGTERAATAKER